MGQFVRVPTDHNLFIFWFSQAGEPVMSPECELPPKHGAFAHPCPGGVMVKTLTDFGVVGIDFRFGHDEARDSDLAPFESCEMEVFFPDDCVFAAGAIADSPSLHFEHGTPPEGWYRLVIARTSEYTDDSNELETYVLQLARLDE